MSNPRKQSGMTMIGWMVIMGVVLFFVYIAINLLPVYYQHYAIRTAVESLADEPGIRTKTKNEIYSLIEGRFTVNQIDNVRPRDLKIEKSRDGRQYIHVDYDVVVPLFSNVSALLEFDEEIDY